MHLIAKDKQVLIFKNAQITIWTVVTVVQNIMEWLVLGTINAKLIKYDN